MMKLAPIRRGKPIGSIGSDASPAKVDDAKKPGAGGTPPSVPSAASVEVEGSGAPPPPVVVDSGPASLLAVAPAAIGAAVASVVAPPSAGAAAAVPHDEPAPDYLPAYQPSPNEPPAAASVAVAVAVDIKAAAPSQAGAVDIKSDAPAQLRSTPPRNAAPAPAPVTPVAAPPPPPQPVPQLQPVSPGGPPPPQIEGEPSQPDPNGPPAWAGQGVVPFGVAAQNQHLPPPQTRVEQHWNLPMNQFSLSPSQPAIVAMNPHSPWQQHPVHAGMYASPQQPPQQQQQTGYGGYAPQPQYQQQWQSPPQYGGYNTTGGYQPQPQQMMPPQSNYYSGSNQPQPGSGLPMQRVSPPIYQNTTNGGQYPQQPQGQWGPQQPRETWQQFPPQQQQQQPMQLAPQHYPQQHQQPPPPVYANGANGNGHPHQPPPPQYPMGQTAMHGAVNGGTVMMANGRPVAVHNAWVGNGSVVGANGVVFRNAMNWHDELLGGCCTNFPICCLSCLYCLAPWRWAVTMHRATHGVNGGPVPIARPAGEGTPPSECQSLCTIGVWYGLPMLVFLVLFFAGVSVRGGGAMVGIAWIFWALVVFVGGWGRSRLRSIYNIPGDQCSDTCIHACCTCCAVSQEARHVDFYTNHVDQPL